MDGREPPQSPDRLAAELGLVQRQLQRMDRQLAALEQALVEAQQALATVAHLAQSGGGPAEALLPVGGGVHVRATVDGSQPVLVPIGAGYSTEAPAAEAATALEERLASLQRQFQQVGAETERLAQAAAAMQDVLRSILPPHADMV